MQTNQNKTCETCIFWVEMPHAAGGGWGTCRRYPPAAEAITSLGRKYGVDPKEIIEVGCNGEDSLRWPWVYEGEWCGEWKLKENQPLSWWDVRMPTFAILERKLKNEFGGISGFGQIFKILCAKICSLVINEVKRVPYPEAATHADIAEAVAIAKQFDPATFEWSKIKCGPKTAERLRHVLDAAKRKKDAKP